MAGPYHSAAQYTSAGCRFEQLYGLDFAATLGGGSVNCDFVLTAQVREQWPQSASRQLPWLFRCTFGPFQSPAGPFQCNTPTQPAPATSSIEWHKSLVRSTKHHTAGLDAPYCLLCTDLPHPPSCMSVLMLTVFWFTSFRPGVGHHSRDQPDQYRHKGIPRLPSEEPTFEPDRTCAVCSWTGAGFDSWRVALAGCLFCWLCNQQLQPVTGKLGLQTEP